jgi:hypothetical protein
VTGTPWASAIRHQASPVASIGRRGMKTGGTVSCTGAPNLAEARPSDGSSTRTPAHRQPSSVQLAVSCHNWGWWHWRQMPVPGDVMPSSPSHARYREALSLGPMTGAAGRLPQRACETRPRYSPRSSRTSPRPYDRLAMLTASRVARPLAGC